MKGQLTPDEIRANYKKEGVAPTRPYNERPILISTTGTAQHLVALKRIQSIRYLGFLHVAVASGWHLESD